MYTVQDSVFDHNHIKMMIKMMVLIHDNRIAMTSCVGKWTILLLVLLLTLIMEFESTYFLE